MEDYEQIQSGNEDVDCLVSREPFHLAGGGPYGGMVEWTTTRKCLAVFDSSIRLQLDSYGNIASTYDYPE